MWILSVYVFEKAFCTANHDAKSKIERILKNRFD